MHSLQTQRLRIWVAGLALAVAVLVEGASSAGWLQGLENVYSDLAFRLAGQMAPVEHVALVELDDASLAAYPDDPLIFWTPHHAKAVSVLRAVGARVVGLDFLFSISPEGWFAKVAGPGSKAARAFDQRFRQELSTGKLVLGSTQTGPEPFLPAADYVAALPDFDVQRYVGATDLLFDADGTLRSMPMAPPGAKLVQGDGLRLMPFSLLLALHASGQKLDAPSWQFGKRELAAGGEPWRLAWVGPPGTVKPLSMRTLLAEGAENNPDLQKLRDKVVIIGVAYAGSNDIHMTPYGHGLLQNKLMRGPEIQAQAIEALMSGRFIDDLPLPMRWAVLAGVLVLGGFFWLRLSVGWGAVVLGSSLVLWAVLGYLAHLQLLAVPVAEFQLASTILFLAIYGLRFSTGERERDRVRKMFSRYVSSEVVKTLLSSGEMPVLGGQALDVTVLFSDIRNFTTISERLKPEEVVEMLNLWFERACAVIQREGGSVDKFIGDAIMAEFGAPLPYPDHPRRALRAALGLQEVAVGLQAWMAERFADRDVPEFAIGVGVHSGTAVVGNIGSSERMEYTAIGDTVNLASRLEGVTKQLGCAVAASRATVERAGDGVQVGPSQTLTVKGREEAVEVLAILGMEK